MVLKAIIIKPFIFGTLAFLSLSLGMIGIVLRRLPSTEFILLAVWAADRSSPRMHDWLMDQPFIEPIMQLASRQNA